MPRWPVSNRDPRSESRRKNGAKRSGVGRFGRVSRQIGILRIRIRGFAQVIRPSPFDHIDKSLLGLVIGKVKWNRRRADGISAREIIETRRDHHPPQVRPVDPIFPGKIAYEEAPRRDGNAPAFFVRIAHARHGTNNPPKAKQHNRNKGKVIRPTGISLKYGPKQDNDNDKANDGRREMGISVLGEADAPYAREFIISKPALGTAMGLGQPRKRVAAKRAWGWLVVLVPHNWGMIFDLCGWPRDSILEFRAWRYVCDNQGKREAGFQLRQRRMSPHFPPYGQIENRLQKSCNFSAR